MIGRGGALSRSLGLSVSRYARRQRRLGVGVIMAKLLGGKTCRSSRRGRSREILGKHKLTPKRE